MDFALTVREPTIGALVDGRCRRIWRAPGTLSAARAGDRLWIREPYHMDRAFDRFAPTVAVQLGAKAYFTADLAREGVLPAHLGPRRFARTLPRARHRQHLVIEAIGSAPLSAMTEDEALAQGFRSLAALIEANPFNGLAFNGVQVATDPQLIVIDFVRIAAPLDPAGRQPAPQGQPVSLPSPERTAHAVC